MIEVKNLTKKYGETLAVNGISFTLESGAIYGFLGPNGAGKSTTMNTITGCIAPTDGTIRIDGLDIYSDALKVKKRLGYLPEVPPLYPELTVSEFLMFIARAKGMKGDAAIDEVVRVMNATNITDKADKLCSHLSKGYKQRVGIAQAIVGDPDMIVLDEPSAGLDPEQIDYINAHGTGTPNNDLSEGTALERVFGAGKVPPVSSTKCYTGHTTSASGGIESVISILALLHNFCPVNLNFKERIEGLSFSPVTEAESEKELHNVLSNSFGFGGNDSSLIFSKIEG